MGDIYIGRNEDGELTHSAYGSQKPNHKYYKRELRNGKWVYYYNRKDYRSQKKMDSNNQSLMYRDLKKQGKTREANIEGAEATKAATELYRDIKKSPSYKARLKYGAIKSKSIRNINKGKKKVSEILTRLRKSATSTAKRAKRKATNTARSAQRKLQIAQKAYKTNSKKNAK